jgi:hypothetical protein
MKPLTIRTEIKEIAGVWHVLQDGQSVETFPNEPSARNGAAKHATAAGLAMMLKAGVDPLALVDRSAATPRTLDPETGLYVQTLQLPESAFRATGKN